MLQEEGRSFSGEENGWKVAYMICSFLCVCIVMGMISGFADQVVQYINPEYNAIQKCLAQMKELK
ncbi:hypothetical protein ACFL2R_02480 [Patescibacteria group bacterium]